MPPPSSSRPHLDSLETPSRPLLDLLNNALYFFQTALELKSNFYEALIASAQQPFERARLLCTAEGGDKNAKRVRKKPTKR